MFANVALGPVVSLELFVSRAYAASFHAYHIYPRPVFFFRDAVAIEKDARFCREVLMFLPSIWWYKLMFLEFDEQVHCSFCPN